MANQSNVDVLIYQNDPIALSLLRVLQKYGDITIFTRQDIGDIIPDIIIFTENDPYRCVDTVRGIPMAYRGSKLVYMRKMFDSVTLGLMQYIGILNLLSTDLHDYELHRCLKIIGLAPVSEMTKKKVTKFYNKYYGFLRTKGLTFKQSMVLGARVRGYSWRKLSAMLGMTAMRFGLECNAAKKALGLNSKTSRTLDSIIKYGGITQEGPYKLYSIPKSRRHKSGYYLLPHIILDNDEAEK